MGARPLLELDARLASVVAEARDVVERLRDLGARALALSGGVEVDAARMAAVEERLELLDRVRRRHGGTLDRALAELEEAGDLVEAAEGEGDEALRLAGEVAERESGLAAAATRLSARRALAATALERAVTERLRRLRLPQARFRVVLSRTPDADGLELDCARVGCGPDGIDAVDFRLATTADGVPLPLDSCASGGELSRVALALRAVAAAADDCPTLVLDEVDIGLGGETAARVGEVLAEVAGGSVQGFAARVSRVSGAGTSEARGGDRQVVVITHRAEIAARACHHLVVTRRERGGGAIADVARVEGEERVAEVARLMSGKATPAALLRARELLADGARRPAQRGRPAPARRNRAAGGAR